MAFLYGLSLVVLFWAAVYLAHTFLIECTLTSARYAKLLSKNGFSINPLQIKWYTVRCNRLFMRLSAIKPNFLRWWFNFGVVVGILGQFGSIFLLSYTLLDFFRQKPVREQLLVPVVSQTLAIISIIFYIKYSLLTKKKLPGVNLPSDQTVYYFLALFICGIVHEFGHAIAASRFFIKTVSIFNYISG
jgi:hypothetical protein